ncbi:MAG: hypothetical protein HGA70_02990 [Chlorobiaceae bacterium]|nr:hypothetical protein [Chlorobiaceae bacterium]NTW11234.1 hypothetical protein [Chlorobiaceae bacterium]
MDANGKNQQLFFISLPAIAFFLNYFWESLHGLLFQGHPEFHAIMYVPMMIEMAVYDSFSIMGLYLFVALFARKLLWPVTLRNCAIFTAAALTAAWGTEYAALHVRHEWAYLPGMPMLLGVGLLPLLQLALTGIASIVVSRQVSCRDHNRNGES